MANYSINNSLGGSQQNMSTSLKTLVLVYSSSTTQARRGQIYDVMLGTDGTPADNAIDYDISRMTGTTSLAATAVTPVSLNPADTAMLGVANANATAESSNITASSSVFYVGVNQRASYRWVAAPGSELVYPATNLNGFVVRAKSPSYASTATAQIYVTEI